MENYRKNLADDLKSMRETPEGKTFAEGFLSGEKQTEEYKRALVQHLEERRGLMHYGAVMSENPHGILRGLTDLPKRDAQETQVRIDNASTLSEIKSVMESGWPEGHLLVTRVDREGYEKWEKIALEEIKETKTPEELLQVISRMPSIYNQGVATEFLCRYETGITLLSKFDQQPVEELADDLLKILKSHEISLDEFSEDETPQDLLMTISGFSIETRSVAMSNFLKSGFQSPMVLIGKLDKRSKEDLVKELFESIKKEEQENL